MLTRMRAVILAVVLFYACFGVSPMLQAQADPAGQVYRGPYSIAGRLGDVEMRYGVRGADTIRDGAFRFDSHQAAALFAGADQPLQVLGEWHEGKPDGEWAYTFGNYTPGARSEVSELRYYLTVDGLHHEVRGAYNAGLRVGKWTARRLQIAESQTTDTLLRSTLTFADGHAVRSFQLVGRGAELLGRVSRSGLATDTWTLLDEEGTQVDWHFERGSLRYIAHTLADERVELAVLDTATVRDTLHVALDEAYLSWLELQRRILGHQQLSEERPVTSLLTDHVRLYARVDEVMTDLTGEAPRAALKVAVPHYPLTAVEQQQLAAISNQLALSQQEIELLTSDRGLRLAAETDDEAAYLLASILALQSQYLSPVQDLDATHRDGSVAYLQRADLVNLLWPANASANPSVVTYDGPAGTETRPLPGADRLPRGLERRDLAAVESLVAAVRAQLASIRTELADVLSSDEQRLIMRVRNTRLESTYASLDSLVKAQDRRVVKEYRLDALRDRAQSELAAFRALDELARQQRLEEFSACMEQYYALGISLRNLPERMRRVEEAYTDKIWNNIIATVMEERVKKRLTKAYSEVLIPDYLERVGAKLNCEAASVIAADLTELHARMLALRDQDTEALEDKLRGTRDPVEVRALLLTPTLN